MLANAQVSEEICEKMTGHTESTTRKIYIHFEIAPPSGGGLGDMELKTSDLTEVIVGVM